MNRSAAILVIAVGAAFLSSTAAAAAAGASIDQSAYAQPQQLIDIGGRRLNLHCAGSGSPTVIFDAGAGESGWNWLFVHAEVAKKTRACIYDRAGLGFSDASPRPGTASNAVDDLHALLSAAKLEPPFVLVGASYAAMNVRLFAHRHPQWVSGLVLVDGHHEDELAHIDRITDGRYGRMMVSLHGEHQRCTAAAQAGIEPGSKALAHCMSYPAEGFGRALSAAHKAQLLSARYWEATSSELAHLNTLSAAQMRAERRSFGDLPIACLTRGVSPYDNPARPQSAMSKAVEAENKRMQDEIAALSTQGGNRVVTGTGHAIHLEKPRAVIDAVAEVLSKQRR